MRLEESCAFTHRHVQAVFSNSFQVKLDCLQCELLPEN